MTCGRALGMAWGRSKLQNKCHPLHLPVTLSVHLSRRVSLVTPLSEVEGAGVRGAGVVGWHFRFLGCARNDMMGVRLG